MHVDVGEINRGVSWVQFCCSIHDYKGLIAVILNLSNFSRGESCHSLEARGLPWKGLANFSFIEISTSSHVTYPIRCTEKPRSLKSVSEIAVG